MTATVSVFGILVAGLLRVGIWRFQVGSQIFNFFGVNRLLPKSSPGGLFRNDILYPRTPGIVAQDLDLLGHNFGGTIYLIAPSSPAILLKTPNCPMW